MNVARVYVIWRLWINGVLSVPPAIEYVAFILTPPAVDYTRHRYVLSIPSQTVCRDQRMKHYNNIRYTFYRIVFIWSYYKIRRVDHSDIVVFAFCIRILFPADAFGDSRRFYQQLNILLWTLLNVYVIDIIGNSSTTDLSNLISDFSIYHSNTIWSARHIIQKRTSNLYNQGKTLTYFNILIQSFF